MRIFLILFFLMSAGCETSPKAQLKTTYFITWPNPLEISMPRRAIQVITAEFNNKKNSTEAVLDITADKMIMSVFAPVWPKPFRIEYDGFKIDYDKNIKLFLPIEIEYLLTDIILVYAPKEILSKSLLENLITIDTTRKRQIIQDNKVIYEIEYSNKDKWSSEIKIKNLKFNYTIHIKNQKPVQS